MVCTIKKFFIEPINYFKVDRINILIKQMNNMHLIKSRSNIPSILSNLLMGLGCASTNGDYIGIRTNPLFGSISQERLLDFREHKYS